MNSNRSLSAQPQLPIRDFKTFTVAFPSKSEQGRVVQEIERHLNIVDGLEVVVNTNLLRATRLRQSILQRAFEGKLC